MPDIDKQKLRELCERATGGSRWVYVPAHVAEGPSQVRHTDDCFVCEAPSDAIAEFIARCSTDIHALLDRIDELEAENKTLVTALDMAVSDQNKSDDRADKYLARIKSLEAQSCGVDEAIRSVLQKARASLGEAGGVGSAGAYNCELELKIGAPLIDYIEDALEAALAVPAQERERCQLPPGGLTSQETFLLKWLSKEEASSLGECEGQSLTVLINCGLAEIKNPEQGLFALVSLTERGRESLQAPPALEGK